jgi:thiazole tautomerase (transcriptional regulator TenI)
MPVFLMGDSSVKLHVISSPCQTLGDLIKQWTRLVPYADAFHLRYKEKSEGEILEMARLLLQETPIQAKSLIINRHAAVAEELGAGGLHLTEQQEISREMLQRMQQKMRVGRSVHSVRRAVEAKREGMDYLIAGHIFPSASKPGLPPFGVESLRRLVQACSLPVIAIGGIGPENVNQIRQTGAKGVAVISAVAHHPSPEEVAKEMKRRWVDETQ